MSNYCALCGEWCGCTGECNCGPYCSDTCEDEADDDGELIGPLEESSLRLAKAAMVYCLGPEAIKDILQRGVGYHLHSELEAPFKTESSCPACEASCVGMCLEHAMISRGDT